MYRSHQPAINKITVALFVIFTAGIAIISQVTFVEDAPSFRSQFSAASSQIMTPVEHPINPIRLSQ